MEKLLAEWKTVIYRLTSKIYYFNSLTKKTHHPNELKVRISHIIIKHKESKKPFPWQSYGIKKSKEDSLKLITHLRKKALTGEADFKDLAKDYSDCSSAGDGGDLGYIYMNELQKEFEDTAFGLKIGEISCPIWTILGVHIIQRTL